MSRLTRWKSPTQQSNTTTNNTNFNYPPLVSAKTGIRLARLQPGTGNKAISIELVDGFITGSGRIEYDALSYVWGSNERDKVIFCNGKRLQVTKTLVEALSRFRQANDVVTLWIDQICICQERVKERNAQVRMMGRIFKSARKVIVWLGDDYDDSRAGMQLASQLLSIAHTRSTSLTTEDLAVLGLPKQDSRKWKALAQVLRRPWFCRTWIMQEVVLNPHVELVLGAASLTWDQLGAVIMLLEGQDGAQDPLTALPFLKINMIRLRHQGRCASRPTSSQMWLTDESVHEPSSYIDDTPELLDVLLMSRSFGATDPRDKLYALLGLAKNSIDPDYSMSAESVFTDFALTTVGEATALVAERAIQGKEAHPTDEEVRKVMTLLSCAGRQNQRLQLPSWVPDWTTDTTSRPLLFDSRCRAGGHRLGLLDWQPDSGLQLSAILFDTVQVAGKVHLQHADTLDLWWEEFKSIASKRVVRSPGSSVNLDAFANLRRSLSLCEHGYFIGDSGGKRRGSLLDEIELTSGTGHNALHTMTLGPGRGRVPIVSATGYLGLAPFGTHEGDLLCVILGFNIPFALRPIDGGFELLGEAYIQGIMHGEAFGLASVLGIQDIMVR